MGLVRKKEEEEERNKREFPEEIREFEGCREFNEVKMKELIKVQIDKLTIGDVKLDSDEKAALSLHLNFVIRKCIDEEERERDIELGLAKVRYEVKKIRKLVL